MTSRPPTTPAPADIPAVHAAIAPVSTLLRDRRSLYQLAIELLRLSAAVNLEDDAAENPLARHRIGEALAGRASLECADVVPISDLVGDSGRLDAGVCELAVAWRRESNRLLAGALDGVGTELGRQRAASGPLRLITEAGGERAAAALEVLRDGVALARSTSRELIDDLLPHIALVGIIDPPSAGRMASASSRSFPGLVLLESPRSSIEAAEALVHEGAHQKLFELAITRDLLTVHSDESPPFHPLWAPDCHGWPLEQTLAAGHAYACLARFSHDSAASAGGPAVGPDSLLPVANERFEIIAGWLLDRGDHLGADAHVLLAGLLSQRPRRGLSTVNSPDRTGSCYTVDPDLQFRRCKDADRVLVGRPSQPPQLFWLEPDAALALELLGQHRPTSQLVGTFAARWDMLPPEASDRVALLLRELAGSGLVRKTSGQLPTVR